MEYKVIMPYIGGVLSDNGYKFLNKNTRPIVTIWKKELAQKVEALDIPEAEEYEVEVRGRFTDERRPDIPNLFKVLLDGLKKTNYYKGLGLDDKHIHPKDAGYTLGHLDPEIEIVIRPLIKAAVVVVLSGGMDSTTLLYDVLNLGHEVYPICFHYGQKHKQEVGVAQATCEKLGLSLEVVKLDILRNLAPSALTRKEIEIPKGHYEDESMRQTVVPNRNMVFLAFATAYAIGIGADVVAYGAHSGDHAIYPDCRPEFVEAMAEAIGLCDYKNILLQVPYLYLTKADILRKGLNLGVDYSLTWTCYEGKELACGLCGACTERLEAFEAVGVRDPLRYKEV